MGRGWLNGDWPPKGRFRSITVMLRNNADASLSGPRLHNVIVLDHQQSYRLAPGFVATMYLDTSHKEASGLLLDMSGFRFLDLNDCNTSMSELPKEVDVLAAQFSGATWYPGCYDYPPEVMQKKADSVRHDLMDTLIRKVLLTNAKAYIPSAGPPCFLDPALERHNDRQKLGMQMRSKCQLLRAPKSPPTSKSTIPIS
jgi:hypothetical protein